ncbi:MAG TPA: type II toxin-antitoxin system VapC family toxin [Sulfurovum sp.]|nr:type II toxin-antitoxin system VapC family toxin [Sulfurovum sp.]
MIVLDANYILRYLIDDNHVRYLKSKETIESNACLVLNEVVAEVIYVLKGVYKTLREKIVQSLIDFIEMENLSMHESKEILVVALKLYESKNLDFIDCYLCALKEKHTVKTFDKKLMKCVG